MAAQQHARTDCLEQRQRQQGEVSRTSRLQASLASKILEPLRLGLRYVPWLRVLRDEEVSARVQPRASELAQQAWAWASARRLFRFLKGKSYVARCCEGPKCTERP